MWARNDWPGNVRELINAIERAVLLGAGTSITVDDLPSRVSLVPGGHRPVEAERIQGPLEERLRDLPILDARRRILDEFDRRYLGDLLGVTKGKIGEAAERAGISERTLRRHLKRLDLRKEHYRPSERSRGGPIATRPGTLDTALKT